VDPLELARRRERQQRFREEKAAAAAAAGVREPGKTLVALRSEEGVARGMNQNLEKDFLRLTTLPRCAGDWGGVGLVDEGRRHLCTLTSLWLPPDSCGSCCRAGGKGGRCRL
jgi:hypothetical protein